MHIPLGYLNWLKITSPSCPLLDLNTIYLIFHQGLIMPRYYESFHGSVSSKAVHNIILAWLTHLQVIAVVGPRIQVSLQEQVGLKSQEGLLLLRDCHSILRLPARQGKSIALLSSEEHKLGFLRSKFPRISRVGESLPLPLSPHLFFF